MQEISQKLYVLVPAQEAICPEPQESPVHESTQDKVKKIASYFIIAVGLLLIAGAFSMVAGHAVGLLAMDSMAMQTVFICGLSAALGGFSIQSSNLKAGLPSMLNPSLTFKYEQSNK